MNEGIIFQQLMALTEKMAKVEQMYFSLAEGHKEQAASIKDLGSLMLEIKQEIGKLDGRSERGDITVHADTNIDSLNNQGDGLHIGSKDGN